MHKGQILRMESEHWRLLQSISSWLHYLHQHENFLYLASHWLYRYACQNVNQNKRVVPVAHSKTHTRKKFHKIRECTLPLVSVKFTCAYILTIFVTQTMVHAYSTVCKSHYEPTVNAQRCVSSALSKCSKLLRN